jgi:hypothetical protein
VGSTVNAPVDVNNDAMFEFNQFNDSIAANAASLLPNTCSSLTAAGPAQSSSSSAAAAAPATAAAAQLTVTACHSLLQSLVQEDQHWHQRKMDPHTQHH